MGRRLPFGSKVVRRPHQALAEVPVPDPVDHHPSRERMLRLDDPAGQLQAAAALAGFHGTAPGVEHLGRHLGSLLARIGGIASNENLLLDHLSVLHGVGHVGFRRRFLIQLLDLFLEPYDGFPVFFGEEPGVAGLEDKWRLVAVVPRVALQIDFVEEAVPAGDELGSVFLGFLRPGLLDPLPPGLQFPVPLVQPLSEFLLIVLGDRGALVLPGPAPGQQVGAESLAGLEIAGPAFQDRFFQVQLAGQLSRIGSLGVDPMGSQHVVGQTPAFGLREPFLFLLHQLPLGLLAVVDFLLVIEIDLVLFGEDQGLHEHFGDMGGRVHEAAGAGKDGDQGVVVPGQDGVELVVVAAGAGDAQSQNALGDDVKLLVVDVVDHPDLVLLGDGLGPQGQKPGGDDPAPVGLRAACLGKQVSGDLLQDEFVVGKVPVEDIDHVIPVTPGMGVLVVLIVAGGVRVAGDVQPVPAPVLSVSR